MNEERHPFADERFHEHWPSRSQWDERRRRVDAGEHEGVTPRGNPEREEDKVQPRSEEYERVLGH